MTYSDFTYKLINLYGPEWLKNQFGKNDNNIPEVGDRYWMEDELADLVAQKPYNDQEYLFWLDDFMNTVYGG